MCDYLCYFMKLLIFTYVKLNDLFQPTINHSLWASYFAKKTVIYMINEKYISTYKYQIYYSS